MLPRLADNDTCTIKVQLKRRLQYKSSALSLNIRPNKVMQAAAWLVNTSPLYQDQGITIDENWLREVQNSLDEANISSAISNDTDSQAIKNSVQDEWSEDEAEIPAGVTDTMLTPPDYVDNTERQQIYNIAPGEGNTPLSVFRDQYSEEMAYPGIFLGQKRPHQIENMEDDSEEIQSGGLLKRYVERPECMQNVTLADWAAWYNSCGQKCYRKTNKKTDFDDLPIENEDEINDDKISNDNSDVIHTISKSINKRSQARIIRSAWFNREAQPEKHFWELLMLFYPLAK